MHALPSKRAERFPWRSQCEFLINGRRQIGVVLNISRTGIFVQVATHLAHRGGLLEVKIPASEKNSAIVLQSCVARKQSGNAGIAGGGVSGLGLQIVESCASFEEVLQRCATQRHGDSNLRNPYDIPYTAPTIPPAPTASVASTSLFRVRVMLRGTRRSRMITVYGLSAEEACEKARSQVYGDWNVVEVAPRCP